VFRSLKFKLTLVNSVVVSIIFLVAFSGIYFLTERAMNWRLQLMMRSTTEDEISGRPFLRMQERFGRRFLNFLVRTDGSGNIVAKSPEILLSDEQLAALVNKAFASPAREGRIDLGVGGLYRYLRVGQEGRRGFTFVFFNISGERDMLKNLLVSLLVMGLAGLVMTILGSFFMAHKALEPVREAWERQKNFVADASHELRSPLAVCRTNLELVMSNAGSTVASQSIWLENIMAENRRMAKLVNDLLFLARADSQQETLDMAAFDLSSLLEETVEALRPLAEEKGISLGARIKPGVGFYGDPEHIRRLAVILLDNAIKYTKPGGRAELELRETHGMAEIYVRDTGEGISSEHIDKIFRRFYRVDKARSRADGSSGLGLSIADWIIREHKGAVKVESVPGKGTEFKVALPKRPEKPTGSAHGRIC